jgi:hypothetical protein
MNGGRIGPTAGNNALFQTFLPNFIFPTSFFHFLQSSKSAAPPNLKAFPSSHALSPSKIPKFSPNRDHFLLADCPFPSSFYSIFKFDIPFCALRQFQPFKFLHFSAQMVALIVASSSPLSFKIFVVILSASIIFGGEIVVAQKKVKYICT